MGGMGDVADELEKARELTWSALIGTMKAITRLKDAEGAFLRALGADQGSDHLLLKAHRELKNAPTDAIEAQIRAGRKALQDYLNAVGARQRFPALADLEDITDREFSAYLLLPGELDPPDTPPKILLVCDDAGRYQESAYISVQSSSDAVVTAAQPPDLQGDKFTVAAMIATCVLAALVKRVRGGRRS